MIKVYNSWFTFVNKMIIGQIDRLAKNMIIIEVTIRFGKPLL